MLRRLRGLDRVLEAINTFKLFTHGDELVVGLSGGADSVYALMALKKLGYRLRAVHINHGLRPTALRDEVFCIDLCNKLGISVEVRKLDLEQGPSLEERGRRERYRIFREFTSKGYKVVLAHTLSDVLETAIFNLARGTGLRGLVIPPKRQGIVRPLILMWRDEIRLFLKEVGVDWVEDETNYDLRFSRNYIRLKVVPLLRGLFRDLPVRFRSTYLSLLNDIGVLEWSLQEYSSEHVIRFSSTIWMRLKNPYVAVRLMSRFMDVDLKSARRILGIGHGKRFVIGKWTVVRYKDTVCLYTDIPKLIEGKDVWDDLNMMVSADGLVKGRVKLLKGVVFRSRREGDRIGSKRLKEVFDKYRIPSVLRDAYPLAVRDGVIVWVPGIYEEGGDEYLGLSKIRPEEPWLFDVLKWVGLNLFPDLP